MKLLNGILKAVESLKTGVKITIFIDTPVQKEAIELDSMKGKRFNVFFSEDEIFERTREAVEGYTAGKYEGKTPSQRLRSALYEYWFHHGQEKWQWEDFYEAYYNDKIKQVKSKT